MRGRIRSALLFCCLSLLMGIAGCKYIPGAHAAETIAPTHIADMTLQLGDIPSGFRLVTDTALTDAQLAQQLSQPALSATLGRLRRKVGTYRVFAYSQPEPSTINGAVQAMVEVDLFDTATHAQTWLDDRQPALEAIYGSAVPVGAPGQRHIMRMLVQRGESAAVTRSVLSFTERNVSVEIATVLMGPGPSLAEDERYANLIDNRILQG
jgi:SOS response regulatory protein OraA/RecX